MQALYWVRMITEVTAMRKRQAVRTITRPIKFMGWVLYTAVRLGGELGLDSMRYIRRAERVQWPDTTSANGFSIL
jgi:hypothetical protein